MSHASLRRTGTKSSIRPFWKHRYHKMGCPTITTLINGDACIDVKIRILIIMQSKMYIKTKKINPITSCSVFLLYSKPAWLNVLFQQRDHQTTLAILIVLFPHSSRFYTSSFHSPVLPGACRMVPRNLHLNSDLRE